MSTEEWVALGKHHRQGRRVYVWGLSGTEGGGGLGGACSMLITKGESGTDPPRRPVQHEGPQAAVAEAHAGA